MGLLNKNASVVFCLGSSVKQTLVISINFDIMIRMHYGLASLGIISNASCGLFNLICTSEWELNLPPYGYTQVFHLLSMLRLLSHAGSLPTHAQPNCMLYYILEI